jgi:hypothetical protein
MLIMGIKNTLLTGTLLFVATLLFAQTTVKGKLTSNTGDPLPYASVTIKGSSGATTTRADGTFSLKVMRLPATLVFTCVGFQTYEYKVTAENAAREILVTLHAMDAELSEVVVTAYGMERSSADKSYSVSAFPSKDASIGADRVKREGKASDATTKKGFTKILTAGELSDFKKWKLWGDYNSSEFSSLSSHWTLSFKKRYCVQVQTNTHKAVVGEKVFLIARNTRDTIWSALTDNTGKAELWGDMDHNNAEQADYYILCSTQTLHDPVSFEYGINRIRLKRECSVSNTVDIAFVVDATGSMGDEIQYLQGELLDIIDRTAEKYKEVDLRLGSVFYRDHGDQYLTRHFDFNKDPKTVVNFIQEQRAGGGGDFPEAVEDALRVAIDSLHWSNNARTKILFLVLDAPPHDGAKEKMKELIQKAAAKGIRIVPVACSGVNKSTEYLLRCAALATNGSYVFLTDDSGVGNPHIKPTTDEFKVELLNELLQRLISEMIYVPPCSGEQKPVEITPDTVLTTVKVLVYPNPTEGKVNIESTGQIRQIYITDFTGKVLMKLDTPKQKRRWQFHLSVYPSGTYLVKYFIEDKGWSAEKVVLIH